MAALHFPLSLDLQEKLLSEVRAARVGGVKGRLGELNARRIDVNCPDASDGPLHVALDTMKTPRANTVLLLGIVRDLLFEGVDAQAERIGRAPLDIVKQIPNLSVVETVERVLKASLSQSADPSSPLARPPTRRTRIPAATSPLPLLPGTAEETPPDAPREEEMPPSPTQPVRLLPIVGAVPPPVRAGGSDLRARPAALLPRPPEARLPTDEPRAKKKECCPECCIPQ